LEVVEEEVVVVVVEPRPPQHTQMAPIQKLLSYLVDVRATSLIQG
jgi:hypothetical protein